MKQMSGFLGGGLCRHARVMSMLNVSTLNQSLSIKLLIPVLIFMICGAGENVMAQDQTDTTITCVVTNNTVVDGTNGTLALSVVNLEMPISYEWQTAPPQTTASITDLPEGVYTVYITDANGYQDTAECSVGEPFQGCFKARTQTQGGWGSKARGNNPGAYRDANFDGAFPNGLTIGCYGGNTIHLTSASAVQKFLPQGGTPSSLNQDYTDPRKQEVKNVLAGQVAALSLSVGFDNYDDNFGQDSKKLMFQKVTSGTFSGWTIEQLLHVANAVLGGCNTDYSYSEINNAVTNVNENFVDGKNTGDYVNCTSLNGGFIGDFVWVDLNGNGIWNSGEMGMDNVEVTLESAGADGQFGTSDDAIIATTTTNSTGYYGFKDLPKDLYRVHVNEATATVNHHLTTANNPKQVNLGYNQSYKNADFGFEPYTSSIGDRVWLDYNGNGLQDSGEPGMPNVIVELVDGNGNSSTQITGANGIYEFSGLKSGTYSVQLITNSVNLFAGFLYTTPINITEHLDPNEAHQDADIGIRPVGSGALATGSIGDFVWKDSDEDATPDFLEVGLTGVVLSLTYANFDGVIGTSDDIVYPPAVTIGGVYTFMGLYPGVYQVDVIANVPNNYAPTTVTSMTVTLAEGEHALYADFGYNPAQSHIIGTVWNDKNGDGNMDSNEPKEPGILLELFEDGGTSTGLISSTAADGSFSFNNINPGDYYINIIGTSIPAGFQITKEAGANDFSKGTMNSNTINLVAGATEVRNAGIVIPGAVGLTMSGNIPLVYSQFTPVTYSYHVINAGGAPLENITITDPDNTPVYVSGDTNGNGKLDLTETWIYAATRTWTWMTPTRLILVSATVDASDVAEYDSDDQASTITRVLGANMDIEASQTEVCPGDTVTLTLTSRMKNSSYLPDGHDAQLINVMVSCNVMSNGAMWAGGPGSDAWNESADFVSTTPGAESMALDADDYVDNDNGFGEADWVHTYELVIPANQTEDVVVVASDMVEINYFDGNTWSVIDDVPPGVDSITLYLACNQAMQADQDLLDNIIAFDNKSNNRESAQVFASVQAYPNPFSDLLTVTVNEDLLGGKGQVFDMKGIEIFTFDINSNKITIDGDHLVNGIYLIRLQNGDVKHQESIIKQ